MFFKTARGASLVRYLGIVPSEVKGRRSINVIKIYSTICQLIVELCKLSIELQSHELNTFSSVIGYANWNLREL
jgi:hypothetical protein